MTMKGKVALITGATSGIGAACARVFAEAGATLMLTGRSAERGQNVLDSVKGKTKADFIAGDVGESAFCDKIVDETVKRFGRLDALVNNAGIIHRADALETSDADWMDAMQVNVNGVFFLARAAVRAMKKQGGGGAIVNMSSEWGITAGKGHVAYCTSKGAVVNMTRALALDHIEDGIRVNAVCPGEVRTPMLEAGLRRRGFDLEQGFKELGATLPIGRVAEPEEIAKVILFLASDDSSYMAGAIVPIDAGSSIR
jgi:meso-butanediol dehydrogenase / (S,S)-butanediol dehydrogenase / diacetyl reductase